MRVASVAPHSPSQHALLSIPGQPRVHSSNQDTFQASSGLSISSHMVSYSYPHLISQATLSEVRAVVPKHLFQKSTFRGLLFVIRDLALVAIFYELAWRIDPFVENANLHRLPGVALRSLLWCAYWWFQSLVFSGWWCLAHEAGHGSLSSISWINHSVGFVLHTVSLLHPLFVSLSSSTMPSSILQLHHPSNLQPFTYMIPMS